MIERKTSVFGKRTNVMGIPRPRPRAVHARTFGGAQGAISAYLLCGRQWATDPRRGRNLRTSTEQASVTCAGCRRALAAGAPMDRG